MLKFSSEKCNGCGLCVEECQIFHSIELDENNKAIKSKDACNRCYHCFAVCPQGAITIEGVSISDSSYKTEFTIDQYIEFLRNKRSIRKYKNREVDKELLEKVISAGYYTPTAGNRQPVAFAIVRGEKLKTLKELTLKALKDLADQYNKDNKSVGIDPKTAKTYTDIWYRFYESYFVEGKDELFFNAPYLVIVLGDTKNVKDPKTDCILAACNVGNAAFAAGLGYCYNGFFVRAFQSETIRNFLKLDDRYDVYASFTLGYPGVRFARPVPREEKGIMWI